MKRVCPNPMPWHKAFQQLTKYAQLHPCVPPSPPKPLILAGWVYSNDIEKMQRWEETVAWANQNRCTNLVSGIPDSDFYYVEKPISEEIGPLGGPMYRPWDFEAKIRPSSDQLAQFIATLLSRWPEVVGNELASVTRPLAFTGEKARRLLVFANATATPPMGELDASFNARNQTTNFHSFWAAINKAIAPHEIDHIDFIAEDNAEKALQGMRLKRNAPKLVL